MRSLNRKRATAACRVARTGLGVAMLLVATASPAATLYFDNDDGTGTWGDPLNWGSDAAGESNRLPTAADNVWVGTNAAAIGPTNAVANTVYVGSPTLGPVGEGLLSLTDTNASLAANALRIGNGGTNGTFKLEKGSVNINANNTDTINLGSAAYTHGTFEMGLPGASDADALFIGVGTGNRRIQVGTATDSSGTFIINSGVFTNDGNLVIGQGAGSTSRTEIHGGTVTINADLNLNNGDMRYEQDGGIVTVNNFNMSNRAADTSTVSLIGGTLVVRNGFNDRVGASLFNLGGTGILDISSNNGTRDVEVFNMTGASVMRLGLYNTANGVNQPLTILAKGTFTGAPKVEVTVTNLPGNADMSGKLDTWIGGADTWDADGGKWDLNVTPDGVREINTGNRFTVITSPNALSNATALTSGTAGWDVVSPDSNRVDLVRTGPSLGTNGIASANIDNAASMVTRNAELRVARELGAGTANLYLSAGGLTLSGTNELVIGGGVQGTVYQDGGLLEINDDLRFGTATNTQGGTYNLNAGTLRVHGDIVETADDVNSAQLMLNGGTLDVDGSIRVQRFSVGETAGTTVSYTVNPTTPISTSGTLAVGGSGNGTLIVDNNSAAVNAANLYVANNNGTGLLIVTNGTVSTTNGNMIVGDNNNGVGTALFSGATVTTSGGLVVGDQNNAIGTVVVHNASIAVNGGLTLGRINNAQGYLRMSTGTLSVAGSINMGTAGANSHRAGGTALIEDGTLSVSNGHFYIAGDGENDRLTTGVVVMGTDGGGGNPQVSINGANTEVGRGGNGTFTMHSGRFEQKSSNLVLAQGSNAVSVVTLNGGDMVIATDINVNRGTGTFNHNGGNVTARDIRLGATDLDLKDQAATYNFSGNGTLNVRRIIAGEDTTGVFNHRAGSITISNVTGRLIILGGEAGTVARNRAEGTYNLGTTNSEAHLSITGANIEVGRSRGSQGVFNHINGTVTINSNNLVLAQHANATDQSVGTYNLDDTNGVLTINANTAGSNGHLNFNVGHGTFNQNGGMVNVNGQIQMCNNANGSSEYNLNAGILTVQVDINFRDNSQRDAFNVAGGTLDMTGGAIHYGNRTGTSNVFTFTTGAMKDVATFNGDLDQEGGTLEIGDGIGMMTIAAAGQQGMAGDYNLSSAGTLEVRIDGTSGAGVAGGHDQLAVAGTVDLDADSSGGGRLALSIGPGITSADVGQTFVIIAVGGTVQGTFASGDAVSVENGSEFLIDYAGGDGNDVELTLASFGPPGTMVIVK
jgi:hypothetical protein